MKPRYTCYFIGDDNLVIECAELWLRRGFAVNGLISKSSMSFEFARKNNIHLFDSVNNAKKSILNDDFDYLFSIINGSILSSDILTKPRHLAINYHNSKLPKYAGAHATSWAIINNEQSHGVTWHVMTSLIDAGDIIKQKDILVDEHDTALSLSIKCYQQALISFEELITDLSESKIKFVPQNLQERTYYDFCKKPDGNGILNWDDNAKNIETIFRALQLGEHSQNRLSTPKIIIENQVIIVNKLHVTQQESTNVPGTIVEIDADENTLSVATKTYNITIGQLSYMNDNARWSEIQISKLNVKPLNHILCLSSNLIKHFMKISTICAKHELFWVNELDNFIPAKLAFNEFNNNAHEEGHVIKQSYNLEYKKYTLDENEAVNIVLTVILIYLHRMGNHDLGVGIVFLEIKDILKNLNFLISDTLPLNVLLHDNLNFTESLALVNKKMCSLKERFSFPLDIFFRYHEITTTFNKNEIIKIVIGDKESLIDELKLNSALTLYINKNTQTLYWYINARAINKNFFLYNIIENSVEHINILLKAVIAAPTTTLSELPILTKKQQMQLINEWSYEKEFIENKLNIVDVFKMQAERYPKRPALMYKEHSMSYEQLESISNQYANVLKKNGLGPKTSCALCISEGFNFIVCMISILKTGAAYIPIDTSYPDNHIQYIFEDSKPKIVLCMNATKSRIKKYGDNVLLITYEELQKHRVCATRNYTLPAINIEDLAYIIYTSGTTGKPKGVMIPHKGITRLVYQPNYINITANDIVAQAASVSFDAATFEIWGALLNGAALRIIPYEILLNTERFSSNIINHSISILWLTSSLFNQYALQKPSMFRKLNYLLIGGDILNKERVMSVLHCPDGSPQHILNGYGPTENTTFTTSYTVTNKDIAYPNIPIGKPIQNTTLYILDSHLQPVPIGAFGELYTGGDGLAIGYLNKQKITEAKFIKNPFKMNTHSLLYKTGDIVRWMPNGNIDYKGRQDSQIKIRGFRVELEAIQSQLIRHPSITESYIKPYQYENNSKIIVAYYTAKEKLDEVSLKNFLRTQLPEYMIPSIFKFLHHFPLTVNGKINTSKLPVPDLKQKTLSSSYKSPETTVEILLFNIWKKLFNITKIGVNDSFFELGGDSLLVTHLALKIKKAFNYELVLHDFLEVPTISRLSNLITQSNTVQVQKHKALYDDIVFDSEINKLSLSSPSCPAKFILLTGATGFLGAHLLNDLYHETSAKIYCLVRADTLLNATTKLEQNLIYHGINLKCDARIVPLVGDLAKPYLGFSQNLFLRLANELDAIYHNGAHVHHLYNYDLLQKTNVLSTTAILNLATIKKLKKIHFISTLSAASNFLNENGSIREEIISAGTQTPPPSDGYSQTKWVSEQILSLAYKKHVPITIFRPAWILGHSITGVVSTEKNHLLNLIKGCIQMRVAPNWKIELNILPVNFISKVITGVTLSEQIGGVAYNMTNLNTISWRELIKYIQNRGYDIDLVSSEDWKKNHLSKIDKNNSIYSLLTLYLHSSSDWMKELAPIEYVNNSNTCKAFEQLKISPPIIDSRLLNVYFDFLEKNKFLE